MMFRVFGIVFGVLAVGAAYFFWQEASYGTGGRDSSQPVSGEAREVAFASNAVAGTISLIDIETLEVIAELNGIPDGTRVTFFRDPIQRFAQSIAEGSGGLWSGHRFIA